MKKLKQKNISSTIAALIPSGVFDQGNTIDRAEFLSLFDYVEISDEQLAHLPINKMREVIKTQELEILAHWRCCRDSLLNHGRILVIEKNNYRVLMPSEHLKHADHYCKQGQQKLQMARRFLKITPPEHFENDHLVNRILLTEGKKH